MTMNTKLHFAIMLDGQHLIYETTMAMKARILCHTTITRLDLNGLMKVVGGEGQRMKKTVVCFGDPLPEKIMRQVTIIAGCDVFVAGLHPRIEVILHHMAIRAGLGIID